MNHNNYNTGAPAKAPISTRIESHIPGTQAHRERKLMEHEEGAAMRYGNTQPATTGATAGGMNTAQPATNMGGTYGTGPTVGGGQHTHTHGATMSDRVNELHGHGPQTANTAKPHAGDKVMGKMEAAMGRATNDPAREQAGWERQTYGDPKHRTNFGQNQPMAQPGVGHNQPMTHSGVGHNQPGFAQQGYGPTGQPAQQAYTGPQAGYAAPNQPPTY